MPTRSASAVRSAPAPRRRIAGHDAPARSFANLIESVYAAAVDQLPWPAFARQLTEAFAATAAAAVLLDPADQPPGLLFATWPEASRIAWRDGEWRGDPWLAAARRLEAAPGPAVLEAAVQVQGPFADRFAAPLGLHHAALGVVTLAEGGRIALLLHRPADEARFSPAERHALAALLGHVPRALTLAQEAARTRAAAGAAEELELEQLPFGVAAVDTALHLLWMNPAFESLVQGADPLRLAAGNGEPWPHLVAADAAQHGRLAAAVAGASAGKGRLQAARLCARAGGAPLVLFASPLEAGPAVPAGALLVACSPRAQAQSPAALLARLFELTRPEAEVAMALACGATVAQVAAARGVSPAAVQGKLRSAVGKTGAASAEDLARIVALLLDA